MALNVSVAVKLLDGISGPMRDASRAVAKFKETIALIPLALRGAAGEMDHFKEKAEKAFKSADHIKHAGEAVSQFAERGHEAIESVVKQFDDFEDSMSRIRALTGATGPEFKALGDKAREIGAGGKFSSVQVVQAMEAMHNAGLKPSETLGQLNTVLDIAEVANVSLTDAISMSTGAIKAFNLGAKDMGRIGDVASAIVPFGSSIAETSIVLGEVGRDAVRAGVSVERLGMLTGLMAQRNIKGGEAAMMLGTMFKVLNRPTGEAARILGMFGVKTTEMVKGVEQARDPLAVLNDLQKNMTRDGSSLNDVNRAMGAMFPKIAPDIQAMMTAAGGPGMKNLANAMRDAHGRTSELSKVMQENGKEAAENLSGALAELKLTLGQAMAPAIEAANKRMEKIIRSITKWAKENPGLVSTIGKMAIVVVSLSTALGGLMTALSVFVAAKGMLNLAFGAAKVTKVLMAMRIATLTSALPFLAIALAIGAVTLAIVQLVKAWDTLDMGESFNGLKEAFGDGSIWKTMTLNPFSGLGESLGFGAAPLKDPLESSGFGPTPEGEASPMDGEAPTAKVHVQVDSEGRAAIKNVKAKGGVELSAEAGMVMVH